MPLEEREMVNNWKEYWERGRVAGAALAKANPKWQPVSGR